LRQKNKDSKNISIIKLKLSYRLHACPLISLDVSALLGRRFLFCQ
jgi:hypothetical protein